MQGEAIFEDVKFFSAEVNYEVVYVICPPGCHEAASVIGRTIYHPATNVCAAGIVDNSIPKTGGLMGVVRSHG